MIEKIFWKYYQKNDLISNKYFWFHISQQAPKWLFFDFRPQIPQSIDNSSNRQVHYAFFWTQLIILNSMIEKYKKKSEGDWNTDPS